MGIDGWALAEEDSDHLFFRQGRDRTGSLSSPVNRFQDETVRDETDQFVVRFSHIWFVLKYLLGLDHVKTYDGSWTEYGVGPFVGTLIETRRHLQDDDRLRGNRHGPACRSDLKV